jgi:hypothetical protein
VRQEEARPLLDAFAAWLDEQHQSALPKSPIGQAVAYARSNWSQVVRAQALTALNFAYPPVLRPVRTRNHLRAHPRQNRGHPPQGKVDRGPDVTGLRSRSPRRQTEGQSQGGGTGPSHLRTLFAVPGVRTHGPGTGTPSLAHQAPAAQG